MSEQETAAIRALHDEVSERRRALTNAENRLNAALLDAAEFRVGDAVLVQGKKAIIRRRDVQWGHVRYEVSFTKKDGTWAARTQRAWGSMTPLVESVGGV